MIWIILDFFSYKFWKTGCFTTLKGVNLTCKQFYVTNMWSNLGAT